MFDRSKTTVVTGERSFTEAIAGASVGDNFLYHTGGPHDGHLMKLTAARYSMKGELFLFQLRNLKDPKKFDYFCRVLSVDAGRVLRMGEFQ